MASTLPVPAPTPRMSRRKAARARYLLKQSLIVAAALAVLWVFGAAVRAGLARNGIAFDMGFLLRAANFDISEGLLPSLDGWRHFSSSDTNGQALLLGFINTLKASAVAIALSTLLGVLWGVGRVSHNWLLRQVSFLLVEFVRNTPLLIQLVFWYFAVVLKMPALSQASATFGALFTQQGIFLPGGFELSPEFAALVLALSVYTAAFIAEIVRGAILALPKGQWEAAAALGLRRRTTFAEVVIPQVMRIVLPSFANQYISLLKSTSLGIAIGFSDLFNVYGTVANQSGRSLEGMLVVMAAYLLMSWVVSALTNFANERLQRTGGQR
jgi:His/Glu/Gln/Arg/opine family amino acid ABC transporter permease subunit